MAVQTAEQEADVAFISGVDANGAVAAQSFRNWRGNDPATYNPTRSFAYKWNNDANGVTQETSSLAGTSSGTITYSFGDGVTAQAQAAFTSALTLWSDIADVHFALASGSQSADLTFTTTDGVGTYTMAPYSLAATVGSKDIPSAITPGSGNQFAYSAVLNFDSSGSFGQIGDYSTSGGYGVSVVTHEVGHVLGLGHAGPYDDGLSADAADQQFNAFDSRQWSTMSYIDPGLENATYYSQYTVTGTNWSTPTGQAAPETPMVNDITAIQRLYGASKTSTFSGGQTYGFNTNIAGLSRQYYDFTTNINPVITLYNTGTNNTLDCSGFSMNCTINLNPGTFSSASYTGMTNNIGIAYGTRIDTAIGGSGNDVIYSNANSNRIDGGGGINTAIFSGPRSNYTVTQLTASNAIVTEIGTGTTDTLVNIQSIQFEDPVCFTTGTRIAVIRNGRESQVPVEALVVGDVAITAIGGFRPIRWIGRREIVPAKHAVPSKFWPVRVLAGSFGIGRCGRALPTRDLRLSPGHPVLIGADADNAGGALVPVMCLINGTSIARVPVEQVVYWHIELDAHDLILAEGLPAESFFECGTRAWFHAPDANTVLTDPDVMAAHIPGRCRPVAIEGPIVEDGRRRLDHRFAADLAAQSNWPGAADSVPSWL